MPEPAWPNGVTARYLTLAGATVDVTAITDGTGSGSSSSHCTGCPYATSRWADRITHERAQAHAETCRALPRPTT